MFKNVTSKPKENNKMVVERVLANLPMTFLLEVRYTCVKTVIGSCTLSNICEYINPLKGSSTTKMISRAGIKDNITPNFEWRSLG